MGKKRKRTAETDAQTAAASRKEGGAKAKARAKSEIADLFAASEKKSSKEETESAAAPSKAIDKKREAAPKRVKVDRFDPRRQPDPPVHRWDSESGLPVYKAHLLKLDIFGEYNGAKGGDTPLFCFLEFVTEVAKEEGWEDEEDEGDED
eukprot:scaffold114_cov361-Pinguiococcus_pyrenoidosus.AAC.16